jgi:hypothetical protein
MYTSFKCSIVRISADTATGAANQFYWFCLLLQVLMKVSRADSTPRGTAPLLIDVQCRNTVPQYQNRAPFIEFRSNQ